MQCLGAHRYVVCTDLVVVQNQTWQSWTAAPFAVKCRVVNCAAPLIKMARQRCSIPFLFASNFLWFLADVVGYTPGLVRW